MGSPFDSSSLPFQIRVIEGSLSTTVLQNGQPPGILQLVGRALPFRPMKFGTGQRVQTTFYPGNPNASQLTIGPKLKPSVFNGEWNDKYLGDGQAEALKELLEQISEAGVSVEVTWPMAALGGTTTEPTITGKPTVRIGILDDFEWTYLYGIEDIAWEAHFDWRAKGGVSSLPPISATGTLNPREGFADVSADLALTKAMGQAFLEAPEIAPIGLPQSVQNSFNNAFAVVDSAVDAVIQATSGVTSATLIPAAAAQQLITCCQSGAQACANMVSNLMAINLLRLEVQDSALDILRILDPLFDAAHQADTAAETCCDNAVGVQQATTADVIATVRAPAGTDLRDLALKYYGDADGWWAIAQANDITGSAVPAAPAGPSDDPYRPIIIPRLQPGTASSISATC